MVDGTIERRFGWTGWLRRDGWRNPPLPSGALIAPDLPRAMRCPRICMRGNMGAAWCVGWIDGVKGRNT